MITFGTGGWRAIIGDGFTRENIERLSMAIANRIISEGCVEGGFLIGYDRRFLSRESAQWSASVFAARGVPVSVITREAPTPLIMYTMRTCKHPYGMAITASHNPALYNGVKVFTVGGCDAQQSVTDELAADCATIRAEDIQRMDYAEAVRLGKIMLIDPMNGYIDSVLSSVNTDIIRNRGLKVVLDPMYGVSRTALMTVLMTARCDVTVIHDRHDTLFGGRLPAPNVHTLGALKASVTESGADIGIATDGDADRLGIIDEKGRFIHPNEILSMLYYYLMEYKGWRGPVVRNIATTHMLDEIAHAYGQECYEVPVGFKHISATMEAHDAIIGGESSGGLTVRGHIQGKDGIYAAALLVEMLCESGLSLSAMYQTLTERFGLHCMAEHNYDFDPARRESLIDQLMVARELPSFNRAPERISYEDGLKVYWSDGWIIVRFSGTEPLLRIFCEMPTLEAAEVECHRMAEFLKL